MATMYALNTKLNGVELYFDEKPERAIIETLKANRWKWHNAKKCWYTKNSEKSLSIAKSIASGEAKQIEETQRKSVAYYKNISDYITKDEYEKSLREYYSDETHTTNAQKEEYIRYSLEKTYTSEDKYHNLSKYIRQAIIWKSLGMPADKFQSNGDNHKYNAIWHKLPVIEGLKATGKVYSAMWGYDQTQITTATHYGKAFGLDVLITGAFGRGEVLLKRIPQDGKFSEGCMYFTPNRFSAKEIEETNTYTAYNGR